MGVTNLLVSRIGASSCIGACLSLVLALSSTTLVVVTRTVVAGPAPPPFFVGVIPFFADLLKLVVTWLLMLVLDKQRKAPLQASQLVHYIAPAVLYAVHNNLMLHALQSLEPWTYQVLANLKIVTTALLFLLVMGRNLSNLQWNAAALLVAGTATSQIAPSCAPFWLRGPDAGYANGALLAIFSALIGLHTEICLRDNDDSLWHQNLYLYASGVVANLANVSFVAYQHGVPAWELFQNVTAGGAAVAVCMAFTGLVVSWVMKHVHPIQKVLANVCSLLLTLAISVAFLGSAHGIAMYLGVFTMMVGSMMYYCKPQDLVGPCGQNLDADFPPPLQLGRPCTTRASTHPSIIASCDAPAAPKACAV